MSQIELFLLEKALSVATSSASKLFCISELKKLESHTSNVFLRVALAGLEQFLAVPPADTKPSA